MNLAPRNNDLNESWTRSSLANAEMELFEIYNELRHGEESNRQFSLAFAIQLIMLIFYIVCLILVSGVCGGTIRYVFVLKALALLSSQSLEVGKNAIIIGDDKPWPGSTFFLTCLLDHRSPSAAIARRIIDFLTNLRNLMLALDESVSVIFFHELHQCTSKMRLRNRQVERVVKKFLMAATMCLLLNFLQIPIIRAFPVDDLYISVRATLPIDTGGCRNVVFLPVSQRPSGRLLLPNCSFQKRALGVPGIFCNSLRNRRVVIQPKQTG